MFRFLRRSLAAASLLLLLATVALWVRGYWVGDEILLTTYSAVPIATPDPYGIVSEDKDGEPLEDCELRKEQEARALAQRRANCRYGASVARGGAYLNWVVCDLTAYPQAPNLDY